VGWQQLSSSSHQPSSRRCQQQVLHQAVAQVLWLLRWMLLWMMLSVLLLAAAQQQQLQWARSVCSPS
jgi:hypothetical protein